MLKRILTGLYHFSWYAFAFIVLNAAVLVTVVRLALPEIGGYKDEIQSWVSEYMDYPVVIDKINAEWQGWAPQLYLSNIDLYTPDNSSLIINFDSAHLGIDLIASLNNRELVPSQLSINGLNLIFSRNIDGSISIDNSGQNNLNNNNNTNNNALSEWLLKQKHITLENANLIWHDKKNSKEEQQFSNVKLELKTQDERVQLDAVIPLPEEHGQRLTMRMDVWGNILTPNWRGTVYAEAKNVIPTKLLEHLPIKSSGGIANAKFWSNWDQAKLIDISAEVQYSDFSLNTDQYNLPIQNLNLNLRGERKQDRDWLVNLTIENLQTSNNLWPKSNYQLDVVKNESDDIYQYSGYFSYLNLEEVVPFLVAANLVPVNILEEIHWQSVKGELTNTNFNYKPDFQSEETIAFKTSFNGLQLTSNDMSNSINSLYGSIRANNNHAKIKLESNYSELNIGSMFEKPFQLSQLTAEFELSKNDSIDLLINKFHVEDGQISLDTSGKIIFTEEGSPFIDIVSHIDKTSVEYFSDYMSDQVSPDLKKWFEHALLGGELLSADMIYRGNSTDFPFSNSEGIFKTIINVENLTLDYSEGWPPVDNISAEVIIDNDNLYVSSKSAYIFDATIHEFTANVKNMGKDNLHLIINGSATGHTSDAGHFISQSPLNENPSLSELTENISGSMALKLGLDIPIGPGHTLVDGLITFTDTAIASGLPSLGLEKVNGDVNFSREATWGSDIDALYHGIPVKLDIPKFDQSESDSESYVISGIAKESFFINELISFFPSLADMQTDLLDNFTGESKWSLSLKKSNSAANINSREVEFNSDLQGIAINLPLPIGKTTAERRPLSIKTKLSDLLIEEININYDNIIYSDFNVDNTNDLVIENVHIGLGKRHPYTPTSSDISIQGKLDKLDVSNWIGFISPNNSSVPQSNTKQKTIDGNIFIENFNLFDNDFNNINISFSNANNGWDILLDGDQIKGNTIISSANNNRLLANFEKLTLKESDSNNENDSNQIDINKIPELEVNVDEFIYNDNNLGKLNLLTNNIDNGININNLSIIKPGFSITANGDWLRIDDVDRSDFHATLEAESIETMLSTFNFNSANIKEGKTNIEMNAYWVDTPMNFSLEKIDGVLDMKIEKGQFLDIEPSAGRLFGLLSLQMLPRRLTLDFTDLFEEGFAFDSIKGNFSLEQGHAYTNNLEMAGPSADIIVSGRTGLSTEDYDQIATVTPKISSGLPVASALFGPVGVGVGAVIYVASELFKSIPKTIDKILKLQYTITGSWDNPHIEKIEKESG